MLQQRGYLCSQLSRRTASRAYLYSKKTQCCAGLHPTGGEVQTAQPGNADWNESWLLVSTHPFILWGYSPRNGGVRLRICRHLSRPQLPQLLVLYEGVESARHGAGGKPGHYLSSEVCSCVATFASMWGKLSPCLKTEERCASGPCAQILPTCMICCD